MTGKAHVRSARVWRIADREVLFSYEDATGLVAGLAEEMEAAEGRMIADAASVYPGGHREAVRLTIGVIYFYIDVSSTLLYAVGIKDEARYMERLAYDLAGELGACFDGEYSPSELLAATTLRKAVRKQLEATVDRYDAPAEFDATFRAQRQASAVQQELQAKCEDLLETGRDLQALQDKTREVDAKAGQFGKETRDVRTMFYRQKMKIAILIGIICAVLLVWICVSIFR